MLKKLHQLEITILVTCIAVSPKKRGFIGYSDKSISDKSEQQNARSSQLKDSLDYIPFPTSICVTLSNVDRNRSNIAIVTSYSIVLSNGTFRCVY